MCLPEAIPLVLVDTSTFYSRTLGDGHCHKNVGLSEEPSPFHSLQIILFIEIAILADIPRYWDRPTAFYKVVKICKLSIPEHRTSQSPRQRPMASFLNWASAKFTWFIPWHRKFEWIPANVPISVTIFFFRGTQSKNQLQSNCVTVTCCHICQGSVFVPHPSHAGCGLRTQKKCLSRHVQTQKPSCSCSFELGL